MGALYEISGIISLDPAKAEVYQPLLERLRCLGVDISREGAEVFWISSDDVRPYGGILEVESLIRQLGLCARQATCFTTRCDAGDAEPLWVGPDQLAIIRAQIQAAERELAGLTEKLAMLKEAEQWLLQNGGT